MVERQFQSGGCSKVFILVCAVTVVLCSGFNFASEAVAVDDVESGPARYRVFSLKHISAERGKEYLADARIDTVSQLPDTNALLVTAQPRGLIKASAILRLVDAEEEFVIKAIFSASEAEELPSNEEIEAEVGDISIGTFSNPPGRSEKAKAIIDIHGDAVVAIASGEQLERIVSAIGRLQKAETEPLRPAEPNKPVESNQIVEPNRISEPNQIGEPNQTDELKAEGIVEAGPERIVDSNEPRQVGTDANERESDELFSELLSSLADAEKVAVETEEMAAESREVVTEPNKPDIVSTIPEPDEPGKVSADSKEVEEPGAEDVAEEPKPEPELEEVAAETEQPEEVAELAAAIRSYEPEPVPIAEEELELNLPEKLNVVDLLDLVGKYLDLDYMYDPAQVKGEVTLKVQGPIKVKELYPMLESVLKFKDFVMTRKGNLVTIVPKAKVLDIDPDFLSAEEGKVQYGDVLVTRIFWLQYIDTASAQNLLTGMKLGASITAIAETGTLIVTGYAYRMSRVEELLEMIDRPGEPKQFRFRQLRYTMAEALVPKIKELAEQLGTVSVSITAPAAPAPPKPRRGRRPAPKKPAPVSKAAKPAVYLNADERTNRILMIGFEGQLAVVEQLIDSLDVAQQDLRTLRLYDIQYVGAEEVRDKLTELGIIGGGAAPARRITRPAAKGRPAAPSPTAAVVEEPQVVIIGATNSLLVNATAEQHTRIAVIISYVDSETLEATIPYKIYGLENQSPEDLAEVLNKLIQETVKDKTGKIERVVKREEDIIIVPDESTFSLIVYASKKNQEWIRALIKDLDKRRPQVLIDVSLVEITRDDDFEYDLELISSFPNLDYTSGLVESILDMGTKPFEDTEDRKGRARFQDVSFKKGTGKGFYGSVHIQALLTLMQTKNYGRVLAKPKILVNDNEEGVISTTERTYVVEQTTLIPQEGIAQTTTKWTEYPAKIELRITPHISEGDLLRLQVSMTREDFEKKEAAPPDYTTSNVDTVVTVPDGSTIILGGLTKLNQTKGGSKVPLLGDIPLVGGLFRTISNSDKTSKLYIFVKANILRPDETVGLAQLQQISAENRAAFEKGEQKFQEKEDWPGIKPKPVEPLHVLEAK